MAICLLFFWCAFYRGIPLLQSYIVLLLTILPVMFICLLLIVIFALTCESRMRPDTVRKHACGPAFRLLPSCTDLIVRLVVCYENFYYKWS